MSPSDHRREPKQDLSTLSLETLVEEIHRRGTAEPADFPEDLLQALEQVIITVHGAKFDAGVAPARAEAMQANSPTAVLVTATEMMKSANLEIFELGMWQSWSGTR